MAVEAAKHGYEPKYDKRARPLHVSGVGHGSQQAPYDCTLPVAFRQKGDDEATGSGATIGHVKIPTVNNSDLPGLLGLDALRRNRAVVDFSTLEVFFLGPGDHQLAKAMPPGTERFQAELAPSGHMVLPCCEFGSVSSNAAPSLTLITQTRPTNSSPSRPRMQ